MIRLATNEDWPSISDISRRSGYIDYINGIGESYLDNGEVYVFEDHGIRGFAKLNYLQDNAAWSGGLRVDPDHWREGVGSALTKFMLEIAGKKGCNVFRVLIYTDNFRSIGLTEKLGGRIVGGYNFFHGIADLSEFEKHRTEVAGYVNSNWAFTKYTEEKPGKFDMYELDGWKLITTDSNTMQILERGEGRLKVKHAEGFTCIQGTDNEGIFTEDPERSTGYIMEIALH